MLHGHTRGWDTTVFLFLLVVGLVLAVLSVPFWLFVRPHLVRRPHLLRRVFRAIMVLEQVLGAALLAVSAFRLWNVVFLGSVGLFLASIWVTRPWEREWAASRPVAVNLSIGAGLLAGGLMLAAMLVLPR